MPQEQKIFRVLVTGVGRGKHLSVRDLCESLARTYPLPDDARISLELGRSAVVAEAATEAQARRTATALVKLGAEVRIEPDPAGVGAGVDPPADGPTFGEVDLGEVTAGGDLQLQVDAPVRAQLGAAPAERDITMVDRPPRRDGEPVRPPAPPLPPAPPPPPAHASRSSAFPVLDTPLPVAAAAPAAPAEPEAESAPRARAALVRCPVHGLLYDANQSEGCRRCLGAAGEPAPRGLKPYLAARPRLRWSLGLAIGLALGALPAGYVSHVKKQGAILEKRVEAESIRVGRTPSLNPEQEHRTARAAIAAARIKGVALTALLWIGTLSIFLLVWFKLF